MISSYIPFSLALGLAVVGGIALYDSARPEYTLVAINDPVQNPELPGWIEFVSEKGGFKTYFPGLPQYVEQNVEDPESKETHHYEIFAAERSDGSVFMINLITYGPEFKSQKPQILLDEVINKMQKNNGNKLTKSEANTFKNYPGKSFQLDQDKLTVQGEAFIVDNKVYVISYIAKKGDSKAQDFEKFLNSFEFTK